MCCFFWNICDIIETTKKNGGLRQWHISRPVLDRESQFKDRYFRTTPDNRIYNRPRFPIKGGISTWRPWKEFLHLWLRLFSVLLRCVDGWGFRARCCAVCITWCNMWQLWKHKYNLCILWYSIIFCPVQNTYILLLWSISCRSSYLSCLWCSHTRFLCEFLAASDIASR